MGVIDLTGQRFGKLTVLERDMSKIGGAAYWFCVCDCNPEKKISIRGSNLRAVNGTKSCGCLNKEVSASKIDLNSQVGKVYGRLTVISRDLTKDVGHGKNSYWNCKCECGKEISVLISQLTTGKTRSCGCLKSEMLTEKNKLDLTNQRFGLLTAIERLPDQKNNRFLWRCECDCGNKNYICPTSFLTYYKVQSCGCDNRSQGERIISDLLEKNNINYIREYSFSDLKGIGGRYLRYDFALLNENNEVFKLIEFDGEQHFNKNSKFYSETIIEHDKMKNHYAEEHKIPILRIPYTDIHKIDIDLLLN